MGPKPRGRGVSKMGNWAWCPFGFISKEEMDPFSQKLRLQNKTLHPTIWCLWEAQSATGLGWPVERVQVGSCRKRSEPTKAMWVTCSEGQCFNDLAKYIKSAVVHIHSGCVCKLHVDGHYQSIYIYTLEVY